MDIKEMLNKEQELLKSIEETKYMIKTLQSQLIKLEDILFNERQKMADIIVNTYKQAIKEKENNTYNISINNAGCELPEEFREKVKRIKEMDNDYIAKKKEWEKVAYNFNSRKERISEIPNTPKIRFIRHGLNDDGSIDLEIVWDYDEYKQTNKNADNIDGFLIQLRTIDSTDTTKHTLYTHNDSRKFTIHSVAPNSYEIGIQAFRNVDKDIDKNEVICSELATFPALLGTNKNQTMNITINTPGCEKSAKDILDEIKWVNKKISLL